MKYIIKKPFKPKGILIVLCVILLCFSCKKDKIVFGNNITEPPDKEIENISGQLYYFKEFRMWQIIYSVPETEDSQEAYLIIEMPDSNFPFKEKENEQVTISGYCYKVPQSDIDKSGMKYHIAGLTYYYIKVTDLK